MSALQRFINRFVGGMKRGIENAFRQNDTYDYSINGRLLYNEDGTWAWTNTKGTKVVFALAANYNQATDYKPFGSCFVNGTLIVCSGNGANSEIGLVRQDQFGTYTYQTAFNDIYDPSHGAGWVAVAGNYDKLNFNSQFNIRSHAVQENNAIERIYWNDDRNEPRVFNTLLGAVNPADFTSGPYMPIGAVMGNPASFIGKIYPSYYSVHGIAQMPDLTWGLIKYQKNIPGACKSGERQYAYRYIHQTGYSSPWSYLSDFVFMTAAQVDAANWTKYQMGASGVATTKGHRLEINHLDQRFQKIEVACLYWQTNASPDSASIIFTGDITGSSILVDHVSDVGQAIDVAELTQKFFNIKNAKTQSIHYDNYYHIANVELYKDLEVKTENITIAPVLRRMLSDETGASNNVPLTHQVPKNTTITKRIFDGFGGNLNETYVVDNDYINYKGTQWTNLFKGHFRKELYPYGILVWNRKGQPLFVKHIADYQFPEQFNNNFIDSRLGGQVAGTVGAVGDYVLVNKTPGSVYQITDTIQQGDNYALNIMGVTFGNIDLTDILFDENGKLQVSGFSIVRMDRIASIVAQGLLCNTVRNSTDGDNYTEETRPLPSAWNFLNAQALNPINPFIGEMQNDKSINARGFWHTFECPDFFLDQTIFQNSSVSDQLRLSGACLNETFGQPANTAIRLNTGGVGNYHYYTKNYKTNIGGYDSLIGGTFASLQPGVSNFGVSNQPDGNWTVFKLFADARNIDGIDGGSLFFREYSGIENYMAMASGDEDDDFSALLHSHGLLLGASLNTCSIRDSVTKESVCYYITNYIKPVSIPQITESLLENRVYHGIGHFVPINLTIIQNAFNAGTGRYVFNNVEVWGGDCYNDFYSYARLIPGWFYLKPNGEREHIADCAYNDTHHNPDYAIGLCFPCESKYNHSLRSGDEYAKVGTQPLSTYCGDTNVFPDGIYYAQEDNKQYEAFDLNKVLAAVDIVSIYNSKRRLLNPDITDFPLIELYAGPKFYGENIDTYRKFLVNNFQFANGEHGEITALDSLQGSLYMFQRGAFAKVRFNERELINTVGGGAVNTGTGKGYSGHDYISTEFGTQHQFSVVNSGRSIYFMDAEKGKMLRFGQDGLNNISDSKDARWIGNKLRDYWFVSNAANNPQVLQTYYDNPGFMGGVHGVYDFKNNSVLYTFTQRRELQGGNLVLVGDPVTIEYSEVNDAFALYHSFFPRWYFGIKQNYLSMDPGSVGNSVHVHDEGIRGSIYGSLVKSKLGFYVNPNANNSKVFDNGQLEVTGDIARIESSTIRTNLVPSQVVILNDSVADSRPEYREGTLVYPMMAIDQEVRMRGQFAYVEYTIDNNGLDGLVQITQHETKYRFSGRT